MDNQQQQQQLRLNKQATSEDADACRRRVVMMTQKKGLTISADASSVAAAAAAKMSTHQMQINPIHSSSMNPLDDPLVKSTLQSIQMTSRQLIDISVKELNQKLVGCSSLAANRLKQCRRTLKNRGYAKSCRIKRIEAKNYLECINTQLMRENRELKQKNKVLLQKIDQLNKEHEHQLAEWKRLAGVTTTTTMLATDSHYQHHHHNHNHHSYNHLQKYQALNNLQYHQHQQQQQQTHLDNCRLRVPNTIQSNEPTETTSAGISTVITGSSDELWGQGINAIDQDINNYYYRNYIDDCGCSSTCLCIGTSNNPQENQEWKIN